MLRYQINWKLNKHKVRPLASRQFISVLKVSGEWFVMCLWKEIDGKLVPYSIEIRRNHHSEEISIFGTLYFTDSSGLGELNGQESKQQFAKLMEFGCSLITIDFHNLPPVNSPLSYILKGVINVAPVRGKYGNSMETGECKNCVRMNSLEQLSNDLESLLDPHTSCCPDVTLKCGSELIPAHKTILSARSPVFAAMFTHKMKENDQNQVDITDMDASVVRAMIIYMYKGETSGLTIASASDILFAANKYQLEDLKRVCCDFLKKNISLQNALRILVLGDLHAENLKYFSMDYICHKCTDFSALEKTEEWKTLKKERPDLAMDVLTSIVKLRDDKIEELRRSHYCNMSMFE